MKGCLLYSTTTCGLPYPPVQAEPSDPDDLVVEGSADSLVVEGGTDNIVPEGDQ